MTLRLIQTPLSGTPVTPPHDAAEGDPTAPGTLAVQRLYDVPGASDRTLQQALGVNYFTDGSCATEATPFAAGVSLYNDMCVALYTAAKRMKRLEEILGPSGVVTDWDADAGHFAEDFSHYTSHLVTYTVTSSYGPMVTVDFTAAVGTSDDPRGFKATGSPYYPCLTPGMKARTWSSTDASIPVVVAQIVNVTYSATDGGSPMLINLDRNVAATADRITVAHDLLPMPWQVWSLFQDYDPPLCQNCIPTAASGYIASIKGTINPYIWSLALAIATDGTDWTFCAAVNSLDALGAPGWAAIADYTVHCSNESCPLYSRARQTKPAAAWYSAMLVGRALVAMTDSSTPPQTFWSRGQWNNPSLGEDFAGSVGVNGILRYLGLCLDDLRAWSTESGGDPPGHTVHFPFAGTSYWPVDWVEGSSTPWFATWRAMAVAAHDDNVGIVAAMIATGMPFPKHTPHGGTGYGALDVLDPSDPRTPFQAAVGLRRSGCSGNWHLDSPATPAMGSGDDAVQRVRPRKLKSLTATVAPATATTAADAYGSLTANSDGSLDWTLGAFQRAPTANIINPKPVMGTIAAASITGSVLSLSFDLGECRAQRFDVGSGNLTLTAPSGGNIVTPPMWRIPDNPGDVTAASSAGTYGARGDMERGLTPGDVLRVTVGTPGVERRVLCLTAAAFAGTLDTGEDVLSPLVLYVDDWLRTHMAQQDEATFLLSGADGAAIIALGGSALVGATIAVEQSAILPNPAYYPPQVWWIPDGGSPVALTGTDHLIDEAGNTLTDEAGNVLTFEGAVTLNIVTVDPPRGILHVAADASVTGSGHLFFEGHIFCRNDNRQIEQAHNLNALILNVAGLPYYPLAIPLSPMTISMLSLWRDGSDTLVTGSLLYCAYPYDTSGVYQYLTADTGATPAPIATVSAPGTYLCPGPPTFSSAAPWTPEGFIWFPGAPGPVTVGWRMTFEPDLYYNGSDTPTPFHYWTSPASGYAFTEQLSGSQLLTFTPASVSILPGEIAQWRVIIRVKNGQLHHVYGYATWKTRSYGLGVEDDTEEEHASAEDVTDLDASSCMLDVVQLTEATFGGVTCYNTPTVWGSASVLDIGTPYVIAGDTYTDLLVDATTAVVSMLAGVVTSAGNLFAFRLRVPAGSASTQSFEGSPGNYLGTWDYSFVSFDSMECKGQFVQLNAAALDAGSDIHFDGSGHQVPGPAFTGGGA